MYTRLSRLMLVAGVAIAAVMVTALVNADTLSQNAIEARQEAQIWTTYAISPYLRASDLTVSVHDGKATLTGKVDEGVNKELANQIALGVSGIKEVDNQIEVQADYIPLETSSARSYGEMIDDASISAAIKSKLMWSKYTNGLATEVNTKRGNVSLFGTAESPAARDLAGLLALNTHGVISVDNQLVVNGPMTTSSETAKSSVKNTEQTISDSWITTKVKSTFLYSSHVDGAGISVTTSKGVVTLSGKVESGVERSLAIELARNVRGVKTVHSRDLVFKR